MLSHPTLENKSGVVEMKDVDPECANICVNHMYGEKVSILRGRYEPMMYVATLMQLHTLRRAIVTLLKANLDAKSFYTSRRIASLYECTDLEEACKEYAVVQFGSISKEDEFVGLDKAFITKMIRSKDVKISEVEKLNALLKWIRHDESRNNLLLEMLESIVLADIEVGHRRYFIEKEQLIIRNHAAQQLVSVSIMDSMGITSIDPRAGKKNCCVRQDFWIPAVFLSQR